MRNSVKGPKGKDAERYKYPSVTKAAGETSAVILL